MGTESIFQNLPKGDPLGFGLGSSEFRPEKVRDFLELTKGDVSRVANVSIKSVRFDDAIPTAVLERLEEIAVTCSLVAEVFNGDRGKAALWFRTKNPMLGDVSPRDMIRLRRFDRLRRFIKGAIADTAMVKHTHRSPAKLST